MARAVLMTLIFFCIARSLMAQEVSLTIEEAVGLALRDNRDVLLKAEDIKMAQSRVAEAQSGFWPSVTFTGGWADYRGLYSKDAGQTSTQLSAKQVLFKGGKTANSVAQARYQKEASQAAFDSAALETALKVKKAFYTILLAREFVALNKGITDNVKAHFALRQARYASGEVSGSEVLKLKESLAGVEEAYEASLSQQEAGISILRQLLYLKEDTLIAPKAELSCEPKDVAYDEGFLQAMQTRPEIKQLEAQTRAAEKSIEIAKADARPVIYASWDYYSRSHIVGTAGAPGKNWNDYNTLGLTFSWPVFDGWQTRHRVEQAVIALKEAQLQKEKTTKDVALEVKNAYLALKNAIAKLKSAQAQALVYEDSVKTVRERQGKGIASSLDVEDAVLGQKVAKFNYTEAVYEYSIAKISFEKATGGFNGFKAQDS